MKRTIKYAKNGKFNIAYQVFGSGPLDLVFVPGHISHLEFGWDLAWAPITERLASFARVILFDKRGTGLSDRVSESELPTLEERMEDVRVVMDAAGSLRAAVVAVSEGCSMTLLLAATHPERVTALVLYAGFARLAWAPDLPWGMSPAEQEVALEVIERTWGTGASGSFFSPSTAGNREFQEHYGSLERMAVSPAGARALLRMDFATDVRSVLPSVNVPTLILHRTGDRAVSVKHGKFLAEQIAHSRFVELPGEDHDPVTPSQANELADEIQDFLTGTRRVVGGERVLTTILFTDIVGSTELAERLADAGWREVLEKHRDLVRRELGRFRGREVQTIGDGFLAVFDGPARAIRCALAIRETLSQLGLHVRAGVHTGECEGTGANLTGIAVHVAARIMSLAGPDEVMASNTVKDLVVGSGILFADHGCHKLKGVDREMQLWRVSS